MKVGLGPGHIVLDGDPAPLLKKEAQPPIFGRWIKVPLGRKGVLHQSDIVLDGDPAPSSPKRGQSPQFSAHVYCGQWLDGSRCDLVRR